jgi:uncharacterized membrane protein YozB (DUF420 family)
MRRKDGAPGHSGEVKRTDDDCKYDKTGRGKRREVRAAIAAILVISAAASAFLFWLIYVHPAAATSTQYAFLPALNAVLNGLSATALLIGYTFIRGKRIKAHRTAMMTAFWFSTLFLVSYIAHHALHGDVRYPLHAAFRGHIWHCWRAILCWRWWRCRWC